MRRSRLTEQAIALREAVLAAGYKGGFSVRRVRGGRVIVADKSGERDEALTALASKTLIDRDPNEKTAIGPSAAKG